MASEKLATPGQQQVMVAGPERLSAEEHEARMKATAPQEPTESAAEQHGQDQADYQNIDFASKGEIAEKSAAVEDGDPVDNVAELAGERAADAKAERAEKKTSNAPVTAAKKP